MNLNVAILWTGGKESFLAYKEAVSKNFKVSVLIRFTVKGKSMCHPLNLIPLQAGLLGLPFEIINIRKVCQEEYTRAIRQSHEKYDFDGVITGDRIVNEYWYEVLYNWLESNFKLFMPLMNMEPLNVLNEITSSKIVPIITCVKEHLIDESWIGRELNPTNVSELVDLCQKRRIDPCGEKGEYHTMVVDAPFFNSKIDIKKFSKKKFNSITFMEIGNFHLERKS